MKTVFYIVFVPFLLNSCTVPESEIVGNYQSPNLNLFYRAESFLNNSNFALGSNLDLNADSTFTYTTCANIITGDWKSNPTSDSLLLYVKTNEWRNDSLKVSGYNGTWPTVTSKPIAFQIKRKSLIQVIESTSSYKTKKTVNILNKNRP